MNERDERRGWERNEEPRVTHVTLSSPRPSFGPWHIIDLEAAEAHDSLFPSVPRLLPFPTRSTYRRPFGSFRHLRVSDVERRGTDEMRREREETSQGRGKRARHRPDDTSPYHASRHFRPFRSPLVITSGSLTRGLRPLPGRDEWMERVVYRRMRSRRHEETGNDGQETLSQERRDQRTRMKIENS